jgi:hypothetical protein
MDIRNFFNNVSASRHAANGVITDLNDIEKQVRAFNELAKKVPNFS